MLHNQRVFIVHFFAALTFIFATSSLCAYDPLLTLVPDKAIPYQPVYLILTWENNSTQPQSVLVPGSPFNYPFKGVAKNELGEKLPLSIPTHERGNSHAVIKPGERVEVICNILESLPLLEKGTYELYIELDMNFEGILSDIETLKPTLLVTHGSSKQWQFTLQISQPVDTRDIEALDKLKEAKAKLVKDKKRWLKYCFLMGEAGQDLLALSPNSYVDAAVYYRLRHLMGSFQFQEGIAIGNIWIPKIDNLLYRDLSLLAVARMHFIQREKAKAIQRYREVSIQGVVKKIDWEANRMLRELSDNNDTTP
ncbi:hypothetical protein ACFLU6_14520 [Acidobacteriota bacterium]